MNQLIYKAFISTFLLLLLTACGTPNTRKDLQNLPSLIEIVALDLNQQTIKLRISHRNQSPRLDNQLSCQLAVKDFAPITLQALKIPDLTTFATETVQSTFKSTQLNASLKQYKALPYVLDCFLFSSTFMKEHIISKATIYRIPGEQNSYR
ncbi:hypothetical protein [Marinicella litoralis]|uniref:Lipoprotein n=1 Tax=Marinicella litoralis TaxID=644220 RepID=A0A4R6XX86_9GAMM|nr:hypothetical protein [Marinicella litoralis]TDR23199.1 hypothetical protein C8D91_0058 [Marinicella litoralis]